MSTEIARQSEFMPGDGTSIFTNAKMFGEIGNIAKVLAQSSIIPAEFQNNVPNVLIALEMAIRMKTSPMQVMQNLYVVNGRPAWSSQYIIAVINASGKYKHELKFEVTGKDKTLSCFAWTTTKDGDKLVGPAITWEMAEAEGWTTKNGSKWKTMPDVMIRYRAASFFGRLYCSDMIMGIYAEEEAATMQIFDSVEAVASEAKAEIAANANKVMIEPPKEDNQPAPAPIPDVGNESSQQGTQGDIDF